MSEYLNPVYPHSFPDPFVLKFRGEYWAYCTGEWPDGRRFGVLHSRDLVRWRPLAGALAPLPLPGWETATCYWAPETVYDNGRFYLYYSVGDEETMEIRVAVSDHPAGPFEDSGRRLTSEPFAIDAHVFVDGDGSRHLFYATDFLDRSHIGTGTVRDRLLDPFTLAGEPTPVALPRHDWHVYHPNRPEKGFVRWHTVEGPFVLQRKGLYYEMFSGGNWQNPTYGVSYAVADRLDRPDEWTQAADGQQVLPILRTLEGQVVGPGHNSVVRGPDNRQLYCVYHRWVDGESGRSVRAMAIDPLDWAGERMLVLGPSTGPRPAPGRPTFADFFDEPREALGPDWECRGGRWQSGAGAAAQREPGASGEARHVSRTESGGRSFLVEVSVRALEPAGRRQGFGVGLSGDLDLLRFLLSGDGATVHWRGRGPWFERELTLPPDFDPAAFHLIRVEVDGLRVSLALDGLPVWEGRLAGPCARVSLVAERMAAEFSGFALTAGWEDLFTGDLRDSGWQLLQGSAKVAGGRLHASGALLVKEPALAWRTLVVNARVESEEGSWVVLPAGESGPRITVEPAPAPAANGWALRGCGYGGDHTWPLPAGFDPFVDQQLRFQREGNRLSIEWESYAVGEMEVPEGPVPIGLGGRASFDAVRGTE